MKIEGNLLTADDGKVLIRRESGERYSRTISLGYSHYIGGVLQDPPHKDVPEDFIEVQENLTDRTEAPERSRRPDRGPAAMTSRPQP